MAALTVASSAAIKASASGLAQTKLESATRLQLKGSSGSSSAAKAFGLSKCNSRLSCSLDEEASSFVSKVADAAKGAAVALATSALLAQAAVAAPPRLTFDEINSKTYLEVKGTGTANQCPAIGGGLDGFSFKPGKYQMQKLCLEPTEFRVKAESQFKGGDTEFTKTKLMTRLTYTLDEIEGPFEVSSDGSVKFEEKDGIDYAAVTVQLPGGERVPFLFSVKELVATGKPSSFGGKYLVPSYRGSSFLDPKGRGGSTGYDNAVALPAGGSGDRDDLEKENLKSTSAAEGNIVFTVAQSNPESGEVVGTFESVQPSDTDLGAKQAKEVKISGIWYGQLK
ncbi:hypothetical protein CBR_g19770 [Chara braunii]|uniref:33 kDa subunit of oxygen evolving system of photosystem II n=1 Tax=Chara braunii TaxID=69332 RepID=A0A388JTV2_CHABU|nr:hypothetical protein CBR_g19770 [Chara braunii]|eukprot:GBG61238.1 hypothetical protein CBR_g19770 [Chara braunii]